MPRNAVARVPALARRWAAALVELDPTELSREQLLQLLSPLVSQLQAALRAEPFDPAVAEEVGEALVRAQISSHESLGTTVQVLTIELSTGAAAPPPPARVGALIGRLVIGFGHALEARLLAKHAMVERAAALATTQARQQQRVSDVRFRTVFNAAAVGISIVDLTGRVQECNPALARMLGYPAEEVVGESVAELVDPRTEPRSWAQFTELLAGDRTTFRAEVLFRRPDGEHKVFDLSMTAVTESGPRFIIGVAVDVTESRRLAERLWIESRHDPLTGLPNRRMFSTRLTEILAEPGERAAGVLLIDLDGFKNVNDSRGHDVGDVVLSAVSRRIVGAVPTEECLVARLGGDEFAVISEGCDHPGGYLGHADEILAAFTEPIRAGEDEFTLSASIGAVGYPLSGSTAGEVMRAADLTLYRAKASGRNRWLAFDADRSGPQLTRHTLATELPAAIKRGDFFLRYQPMVSLGTGTVTGVEALIRWQHPQLGVLPPAHFLPLAEEGGLIVELGRWVLETACAQLRQWRAEGVDPELFVSVNLSATQLREEDLAARIQQTLTAFDLPPRLLQVELGAGALTGEGADPMEAIRALSRTGVRVVVDDFGVGQASLAYLSRLPLHGLKIAGALLEPLHPEPNGQHGHEAVVSAIIGMSHALRLSVIAESVEHPYQATRLRALGCDTAQGWLFGRPGTAEEARALIDAGPVPPRRRALRT